MSWTQTSTSPGKTAGEGLTETLEIHNTSGLLKDPSSPQHLGECTHGVVTTTELKLPESSDTDSEGLAGCTDEVMQSTRVPEDKVVYQTDETK